MSETKSKSILFVYTSVGRTFTGAQIGWYLPEAAHPYYVLAPHYNITFAAPKGPNPPVDISSLYKFPEDGFKFLEDETVISKFANAIYLKDAKASDYDAIFYIGGHGPIFDVAFYPPSIALATEFVRQKKLVAALCHGPATLAFVKDPETGLSIFHGKRATAFSDLEEEYTGDKGNALPFNIQERITELGGIYEKKAPFESCVVTDGLLITGQNPTSSLELGEAMHTVLSSM